MTDVARADRLDALIAKWRYVASREALSSYVVWQMCADQLETAVRELVPVPPAPSGELAAIRALCAEAGMSEQSTTLDYIRSAFYQLGKCQREAQVAAPAPSAPQPDLDRLVIDGMSTFENGCDFTLRFEAERIFLRYGCYGVHVNLAQGARRDLMHWLGVQGTERELLGLHPRTVLALKQRQPCRRCGGFTFTSPPAASGLSPSAETQSTK